MDVRYLANGFIEEDVAGVAKELEYIFSLARNSGLNDLIEALLRPEFEVYDLVDASKLNERLCVTQIRHAGNGIIYTLRTNGFNYVLGVYESLITLSVSGDNLEDHTYEFPITVLTDNQKHHLDTLLSNYKRDTKEVKVAFKLAALKGEPLPANKHDCKVVCEINYDGRDYVSEFNSPKFLLVNGLIRLICDNLKLVEKE